MNIFALLKKAIHDFKNPSDEKLLRKVAELYREYASYHHLQHTPRGFADAVARKESMLRTLKAIQCMEPSPERRQKLLDTIVLFKKYNNIGFR